MDLLEKPWRWLAKAAAERMVGDDKPGRARLFRALAYSGRVAILWRLTRGPATAAALIERGIGMPAQVKRHLARLRAAGLVGARRRGRALVWRISGRGRAALRHVDAAGREGLRDVAEDRRARLRLSVQRVPTPIAGLNLSTACSGNMWKRLSGQVIAAADGRCAVCSRRGRNVRLHCHEKWQYLDKSGVARLVGLQALCTLCHGTVHAPDVQTVRPGKRFRGRAFWLKRCCRINGCTPAEWERHEAEARQLWEYRSALAWRVDLGEWAALVPAKRRKGRWLLPKGQRVGRWLLLKGQRVHVMDGRGIRWVCI